MKSGEEIPVLTYFRLAGRAESIRLAFVLGGLDFIDKRITAEEFIESEKEKSITGKLPTLKIGDQTYVESLAILNYVSQLAGILPSEPLACLKSDMIINSFENLCQPMMDAFLDPSRAEEIVHKTLPDLLQIIDRMISQVQQMLLNETAVADDAMRETRTAEGNSPQGEEQFCSEAAKENLSPSPFLLGETLSPADLVIFCWARFFLVHSPHFHFDNFFAICPNILNIHDNVSKIPKIENYYNLTKK